MNGFNWGMPQDLSTYGHGIDRMMSTLHFFMVGLFVFWGVFFLLAIWKFRSRAGHKATYEPIHATWSKWLEIGVAGFEAILLVGFSMPVWYRFKHSFPKPEESTQVRIVAQQFAWNFWYPGPDGVFGKNSIEDVSGANPVGLLDADPAGKDDLVLTNQLYVPNDKPVYAWVTSKDVIHSFGVPVLRMKQDAIPGMNIPIWFQTTEGATGDYDIACSQLCGNGHGRMRAVFHPLSHADYVAWLDKEEHDNHPELFATPTPAPSETPAPAATPAGKAPAPAKTQAKPAATAAATATAAPASTASTK